MFKRITILTSVVMLLALAACASAIRTETFDTGLGKWVEKDIGGSIPTPAWSNSNSAEGASGPGEFGGTFIRQNAANYPYIGDTSLLEVDETMPLVIKGNYLFHDIPDGDRDPHIMLGPSSTARICNSLPLRGLRVGALLLALQILLFVNGFCTSFCLI